MKKYMVVYHANNSAMQEMGKSSPEEAAEGMKSWMDWAAKCGDGLVDLGAPLMNGQAMNPSGDSTNSNRGVVGYSILQAENLDAAKQLLDGHPHLTWNSGCSIEVHETAPIPGME